MTSNQEKILDDLWSQAVRLMANSTCQWTGTPGDQCGAQACHIVGRRYLSTRWGAYIGKKYDLCGFYASHDTHIKYDQHYPMTRPKIIDKLIGRDRYNKIISKAGEVADNQDFDQITKILRGYK